MLLCLCLLSVFALPMETAAHRKHLNLPISTTVWDAKGWKRTLDDIGLDDQPQVVHRPTWDSPYDVINWVRVYKNPKATPTSELGAPTRTSGKLRQWNFPDVETGPSWVLPSLHWEEKEPGWDALGPDEVWVNFDSADEGGALIDTGENSGLVTATENTTVKPGDRVAIAVNFNTWGGTAEPDMAIGPRLDITYDSQWKQQVYLLNEQGQPYETPDPTDTSGTLAQREAYHARELTFREGPWRLNPNLQLIGGSSTQRHTLVYQFVVGEEHAILNEGPWLTKDDFDYVEDTGSNPADWFNPGRGQTGGYHLAPGGPTRGNRITHPVDWIYGESDGTLPIPTAVMPWNTIITDDGLRVNWGVRGTNYQLPGWTHHRWGNFADFTRAHRHVLPYDAAAKETIWYPKVVVENTDEVTVSTVPAITDVPSGTQTGAFQVTLGFSEVQEIADFMVNRVTFHGDLSGGTVEREPEVDMSINPLDRRLNTLPPMRRDILVPGASVSIFVAHDVSAAGVAVSQTSLTAALAAADPPWTVTALAYTGGIELASSGEEGPRDHGTATRYTLTLLPPLGVKGDVALQIPADAVLDVAGNGNAASETVMVSVDTKTALPLAVVEPPEVVLGTGEVTVSVPFAQDGLTYVGDNPPYLTIYLGDEVPANARHAVWQSESPGSTIVQFVYTGDDIGGLVTAKMETLAIPKGTTLVVGTGPRAPRQAGNKPVASGPGEIGLPPPGTLLSVTDMSGAALSPVQPVLWLPTEESEPKSAASSVPRTPIVFNELGNGSGADNDWLELRNVTDSPVSLKDWELSVVADAKQEDTSLVVFPDVSVPANGLLLLTNMPSDKTPLAGGDDVAAAGSDKRRKGLTHLSLVDAGLSLPDDGKFLLILRNAKEKRGLNEAFVDVAGGGGSSTDAFIREQTGLYDTHVWPLQVLEAPGSDTEDSLSAGKVWLRAKADIVGYHRDAWAEAAFSGLGYDRKVSKSAETAGTPGYPNGAVKTQPATPKGAITMSEVMFDSAGGTLPQWIELYNTSKTEALNLNRWELEIQNRKSEDLVGRPIVTLTLQEKVIQPNQTLLIVTGNARASSADVFPADRVYNLIELHEKNLRIKTPRDTFLSAEGFYLKLTDGTGALVDEIGNTDGDRRTDDTPAWALPVPLSEVEGMRSSLVRRYDKGVAREGTSREGWALAANFAKFKADGLHYGHADDIGTPGYRQGGALPVELSSFTLTRTDSGAVVITWTTESEVDNAGFNLRRSLQRDSGYTLLNPALIAGAGTTGERQTYTFIDTSAKPGVEHYYQIEEVSFGGKPEMLMTRRLRGPVSPAHRALTTFGEVKQAK